MRRRSAVEPVIGHLKESTEMGRISRPPPGRLQQRRLAAAVTNFRRLIKCSGFYCAVIMAPLLAKAHMPSQREKAILTGTIH